MVDLKWVMNLRDKEFTAVHKKKQKIIETRELELCCLKHKLQSDVDRVGSIQNLKNQELEKVEETPGAERQTISKRSPEMLALKLENQRHVLLQNQLQAKVEQLEEMLRKQKTDLLDLKRKNEGSRHRISETSSNLRSSGPQLAELDSGWKTKCRILRERLFVELPVKTKNWLMTVQELRQEMDRRQRQGEEIRKSEQDAKSSLLLQLRTVTYQLEHIKAELQESNKGWQAKYDALLEKFNKELLQNRTEPEEGESRDEDATDEDKTKETEEEDEEKEVEKKETEETRDEKETDEKKEMNTKREREVETEDVEEMGKEMEEKQEIETRAEGEEAETEKKEAKKKYGFFSWWI